MSMLDRLVKSLLTEDRLARLNLRPETQEDLDKLVPVIEFICEPNHFHVMPEPKPAFKNLPDWYKKIPSHVPDPKSRDQFGARAMTAKGCLPLIDGMGLGYTMFSAVDINVRVSECGKMVDVTSGPTYGGASLHSADQLGGSTSPTFPSPAVKFHNPWIIKTRPGYSTLFIPPLNDAEETRFQCLGAVVDTDVYPKAVNFPALWFERGVDVLIPAGTPLVTAIPFKRSDVPREVIVRKMHEAERQQIAVMERVQNARSHMYTHELREDRKTGELPTPRSNIVTGGGCPFPHGDRA